MGQQGAFRAFTFSDSSVFKAPLVHILTKLTGHQDPNIFYAYGSFSTGHTVLAKSELISPKTRDAPWKQVIDCQFSEQTPAPPFSPPAAHKIVNCLGKQAVGNLGVERHKSQRENYGTLLICSWSDGVNEILENHSALNLFEERSYFQEINVPPVFCSLKLCT